MKLKTRKFPYPYKCGLAICSDIDNAASVKSFKSLMDYFNSARPTPHGDGLNMEVGNSFWFFSNSSKKQLSYFNKLSNKETQLATIIRNLWKSGHLDTLHSWGNFDLGGFSRKYAEKSLNELNKHGVKIPVWVNHGIGFNYQKIGDYPNMCGDDPTSSNYHLDLTLKSGCEYFWVGKSTHIIGQNCKKNLFSLSKSALQWIFKKTKYRYAKMPVYDLKNDLATPTKLRDGNVVWEFVRFINPWGGAGILDINEFTEQIKPEIINRLIKNEGYMVIYTHFNENVKNDLPETLIKYLHHLKNRSDKGQVLIATTSRLLKYWEVSQFVAYEVIRNKKKIEIIIDKNLISPAGSKNLDLDHLQGLTFYINTNQQCIIKFDDVQISTKLNPPDETGKTSISIPWRKLDYYN